MRFMIGIGNHEYQFSVMPSRDSLGFDTFLWYDSSRMLTSSTSTTVILFLLHAYVMLCAMCYINLPSTWRTYSIYLGCHRLLFHRVLYRPFLEQTITIRLSSLSKRLIRADGLFLADPIVMCSALQTTPLFSLLVSLRVRLCLTVTLSSRFSRPIRSLRSRLA